ncbi:unnamed protein product, partial [Symbiodinium microadriaticum]
MNLLSAVPAPAAQAAPAAPASDVTPRECTLGMRCPHALRLACREPAPGESTPRGHMVAVPSFPLAPMRHDGFSEQAACGGFELRRTLEKQESGGRNTERRAEDRSSDPQAEEGREKYSREALDTLLEEFYNMKNGQKPVTKEELDMSFEPVRRLTRSDSSACPAAMLGTLVAGVGRRLRLCGVQSSEGRKAGGDARASADGGMPERTSWSETSSVS